MEERINAITCLSWVPRGVPKQDPDKIQPTEEELAKIIAETRDDFEALEDGETEIGEEDYTQLETEALADDAGIKLKSGLKSNNDDQEMNDLDGDEESIEKKYNFEDYDDKAEGELMFKLGKLTVHPNSKEDPYIQQKDEDSESEIEDQKILPTDNLIVAGHVDGDAAILDVYVYNSEESCLYVHHDILLPAVPLCMEWLNFDPGVEDLSPGNLLAVGSMSPVIEVWDLDLIDCLEPAFKLGRKGKKKKKLSGVGHKDAVLALAWNREMDHILASGSVDETVILWDIQEYKVAQKITCFKNRVQALQWHSKESHGLLTGCCDKQLRMFDCRAEDTYKSWKLDGEIEAVSWDITMAQPFSCYASTDTGMLYCIDARKDEPLWNTQAHLSPCTGLSLSSKCPGCLVTISEDNLIKIWDVSPPKPQLVLENDPKLGVLHTISASPDDPFVFSFGGNKSQKNFKVWDIRESKQVRKRFCPRMGLPVDEDEGDVAQLEDEQSEDEIEKMESEDFINFKLDTNSKFKSSTNISNLNSSSRGKPSSPISKLSPPKALGSNSTENKSKKKFKKKKGGHTDKRK